MADQIVPLDVQPNQTFTCTVSIDGGLTPLGFTLRYNEDADYWVLSVLSGGGNLLLDSIPLLGSTAGVFPGFNILEQFAYLKIGSAYILNASNVAQDNPSSTNLGTDFVLAWSDTPAA